MGGSQGKQRPQHQSKPTGAEVATAKSVVQETIPEPVRPVDCVIIGAPQDGAICTILKEKFTEASITWSSNFAESDDASIIVKKAIVDTKILVYIVSETSGKSKYCADQLSLAYISNKVIMLVPRDRKETLFESIPTNIKQTLQKFSWTVFSDNAADNCWKSFMEQVHKNLTPPVQKRAVEPMTPIRPNAQRLRLNTRKPRTTPENGTEPTEEVVDSFCSTSTQGVADHSLVVYVDGLKKVYQTPPPATWLPLLPVSKHIKLAMTKEMGTRFGRGNDELTRHRVKGELEQVMAGKVLVDMDSIFNDGTFENACDSRPDVPLVILVEGALGSGKTTLAHHYCQEWAKGNLTMFNLVALVYLRHPAVHSAGLNILSLDELLLVAISGTDVERDIDVGKVAQHVKDGLKFLLILEGWDEAPACLRVHPNPSDNSFLRKLLLSVSPNTTILITSRPDSSVDLHKRPNVKRVEILGFTKESIHDYFREALSTQLSSDEAVTVECSKLKEHFSKYPAIESSCYVPLNATILTLVYLERNCTLPTTQHELLCELLLCLIDREVHTRQPNRVLESIFSLDDLPSDLKENLKNIRIIAYEGIMQDKVVFSQQELSSLLPQPVQQDLPTMGVLQKVQWAGIRSKKMSYSFSHLSIQELLAAYCISKMDESEQVSAFQTLLDNPRFAAVLQFYAGFTKLTNQGVQEIITGTNMSSQLSLHNYMRCFFEAQITDESLYLKIVARMNRELNLSSITLSPLDCMSVGYFLAFALPHSELRVDLSLCRLNDQLFGLLVGEISKHAETKAALHGVTELKMSNNQSGIAHNIAATLQTNTTMRTLDISCCSISDKGVESLARALAVNRSLQELNISNNNIGDNGIAHIATALQTNTTMRTLDISRCNISDEGVKSLARALAVNRSLQELNIIDNKIGDNGIAHIATALKKNCTLKTIVPVSVTDEGVESLAAALTLNTSLEILELHWSSAHPNITMEKLGVCISTNSVLRVLQLDIYNKTQMKVAKYQQLVEVGGKKLVQSLENNCLQTLVLKLDCSYADGIHQALNAAAATVNSARHRKELLDTDLKVEVLSMHI